MFLLLYILDIFVHKSGTFFDVFDIPALEIYNSFAYIGFAGRDLRGNFNKCSTKLCTRV